MRYLRRRHCVLPLEDDEVFGLEIYNAQIADSQRQIFELLWRQAVPETQF